MELRVHIEKSKMKILRGLQSNKQQEDPYSSQWLARSFHDWPVNLPEWHLRIDNIESDCFSSFLDLQFLSKKQIFWMTLIIPTSHQLMHLSRPAISKAVQILNYLYHLLHLKMYSKWYMIKLRIIHTKYYPENKKQIIPFYLLG
jgi:hypothetical protein